MSVLVDCDIRELVSSKALIEFFDPASLEGASYDMRLGAQAIKHGIVETLSDDSPTLSIKAGEFAILRSFEILNMPLDLIGHNGIMSPWAKRGLVSLFSPQIDPGFRGFLVVPVFNAGDLPISITWKEKIFTVEFVKTTQKASYGWSERHGMQDKMFVPVTPSHVRANLADIEPLERKVIDAQQRLNLVEEKQTSVNSKIEVLEARWSRRWDRATVRRVRLGLLLSTLVFIVALFVGFTRPDWKIPDTFKDKYNRILDALKID